MARPQKSGIDYFPIDVNFDNKVELLDAKYGVVGIGILLRLWQKIYANSYFLAWTEETLLLTKKLVNVDINLINDIINDCIKWDIFDEAMFKRYKILTSKGVQKRYLEAVLRRKEVDVIDEYLLIDLIAELRIKGVNVNINRVNVDINSKNDDSGTQTKLKETKVNNIYPLNPPEGEKQRKKKAQILTLEQTREMVTESMLSEKTKKSLLEWFEYKKEREEGYVFSGAKKLITVFIGKIKTYGENAVIETVDVSMSTNYKGICWDKLENKPKAVDSGNGTYNGYKIIGEKG